MGNLNKHDERVLQLTIQLKKQKYNVKADLPGFEKPDPIGKNNRIPDIEATKNGITKLIEVETERTLHSHKDQQSTFRRSAAQRKKTSFEIDVI
ncbi:MAG: hypothetical protein GX754_07305 [Clostridiaceae bacterium]|nr:hypothetical protein [Clostridiaceae bacterium]